jgi:hypothetical protein
MLPLSTLNSVKERGSNGALRSHLFAKGQTRHRGSRRSLSEGGTINSLQVAELPKTATGKVQKYVLRGKPAISKQ